MSLASQQLAEFHKFFYNEPFGGGKQDTTLRVNLHKEENRELIAEIEAGNRLGILQELADVVIVAYGTAHSYGLPLDAAISLIMKANMRKVGPDGFPVYRESDNKVLKPPGWQPADLRLLLPKES